MTGIAGKICVVTGASSGIGEATATALANEGATVVLAARREDKLRELAESIEKRGGSATWRRCDVTILGDLEELRDHTEREHGRCDVLINNAGIPGGGRFADLSLDRIEKVTATNYLSVLYATKLFLPMLLQAKGHVVNVASLAGRYALPGATVYTASKHAVVAFAESLLCDEAPNGLRVTTVCPAFVPTEGFPHRNPPGFLSLTVGEVAGKIVDVVRRGRVGTVSIPGWAGPPAAVQVLAPRLYRRIAGFAARRYRPRVHSD